MPGPGTPACRAPVITSTSPAAGLLCRSMMPELVNVFTPIKWPCNGPPSAIALLGFPSGRYCPVFSSVVAPVTAGSASVPLLVKLLFEPVPRSAMATRSVSRPPPVVSAKCLRLNVLLLKRLLSPLLNCTKPVMVPSLLMMVLLLMTGGGVLATARSDSAPMLPSLFRVAVPPVEFRITPAAGRAKSVLEPTPVTPACHPPFTDTPCVTLTVTLPPGVPGSPVTDRVDPGAELSRGGNITECIDQHGAGRRGGPDAMRYSALRRDRARARRRDRDVPARFRRRPLASHCV